MDCEFLQRWPSLQALRKARPATLEAFWKTHGSRSEKRLHERLDVLAGARALTEDIDIIAPLVLRVESLVRQLQVLAQSLDLVESRIQELAAAFEDYAFFRALPGAGCAFAPRLLAAYGEDRSRWTSASALQCYSGIAPVTRQSGNTRSVVRRLHCPNFRRQSFHEWAAENWKHSRWLAPLCVTISPEKNPSIPSSACSPTNGSRSSHAPGTTANSTTKSATSNASSNAAVQSANISANNLDLHQHFFFDRQPQR
jgi:hypothetical protein